MKSYSILTFILLALFAFLPKSALAVDKITVNPSDFSAGEFDQKYLQTTPNGLKINNQLNTFTTHSDFASENSLTSQSDFAPGDTRLNFSQSELTNNNGGEITIKKNTEYCYSQATNPAIPFSSVKQAIMGTLDNKKILFAATPEGVFMIDNKNTGEPSDDEIVGHWDGTTSPSVDTGGYFHEIIFDNQTKYLYVSAYSLTIIDTKGTVDTSDDALVAQYSEGVNGFPYVGCDRMSKATNTNLIYCWQGNTENKLYAIDNKDTVNQSDDTTTLIPYETRGYYENNGILYISRINYENNNDHELSVIDTHNDTDISNDTIIAVYKQSTLSALDSVTDYTWIRTSTDGHSLYISDNLHFFIIDNKGTFNDVSDDTVRTLTLPGGYAVNTAIDEPKQHLYINAYLEGMDVYDLNTLQLVESYDATTTPAVENPLFIAIDGDDVYYQGSEHVLCHYNLTTKNKYFAKGYYRSGPIALDQATTPRSMQWDQTKSEDQSVGLRYRLGFSDGYFNDFSNESVIMEDDPYEWGEGTFTKTIHDSILTLSAPTNPNDDYVWIDTGKPAGYFPADAKVEVKYRVNTTVPTGTTRTFSIFTDEWDGDYYEDGDTTGEWVIARFTPNLAFSKIALDFYVSSYLSGHIEPTDTIDIDYIKVINGSWGDWSPLCFDASDCPLNVESSADSLQFEMYLDASPDLNSAPVVNSVSINNGYYSTAEYISPVFDNGQQVVWKDLSYQADIPDGTSLQFFTRPLSADDPQATLSDWEPSDPTIKSPSSQYIQYKALLLSNGEESPIIKTVEISYDLPNNNENTNSGNNQTSSSSSSPETKPPICTNTSPINIPSLFQIDAGNTSAKLHFTPTSSNMDHYYIAFSTKNEEWQFGEQYNARPSNGVEVHSISQLKPNTVYYAQVRAGNGCATGKWSNIMTFKTTGYFFSKKTYIKNTKVAVLKNSIVKASTKKEVSTITAIPTNKVIPTASFQQVAPGPQTSNSKKSSTTFLDKIMSLFKK